MNKFDELKNLKRMLDDGEISQEEFNSKKAGILEAPEIVDDITLSDESISTTETPQKFKVNLPKINMSPKLMKTVGVVVAVAVVAGSGIFALTHKPVDEYGGTNPDEEAMNPEYPEDMRLVYDEEYTYNENGALTLHSIIKNGEYTYYEEAVIDGQKYTGKKIDYDIIIASSGIVMDDKLLPTTQCEYCYEHMSNDELYALEDYESYAYRMRKTEYEYDKKGRKSREIQYEWDSDEISYDGSFEYDSKDNLIREQYTSGFYRTYEYDSKGNILKEAESNGNSISYIYDDDGNLLRKESFNEDGSLNTIWETNEYENGQKQSGYVRAGINEYNLIYNENGDVISYDTGTSTIDAEYEYDEKGRPIKVVQYHSPLVSGGDSYQKIGELEYTKKGHLIRETVYEPYHMINKYLSHSPDRYITVYKYDNEGRRISIKSFYERIK